MYTGSRLIKSSQMWSSDLLLLIVSDLAEVPKLE